MAEGRANSLPELIGIDPSPIGGDAHRAQSKARQPSTGDFQAAAGDQGAISSDAVERQSGVRITLFPKEKERAMG